MASNRRNYIDLLPDEVLCMVFDRLDLQNVKNASLTCRRWNNIIFLSGYVARFHIVIRSTCPAISQKNRLKSLQEKMKLLARDSKRRYRKFAIVLQTEPDHVFVKIWNVIHPKITTNIRRLTVYNDGAPMKNFLPVIIGHIPSMLQLQDLSVGDLRYDPNNALLPEICQKYIPTIRSKSLLGLTIACSYKYTVDLPQLEMYVGTLSALHPPEDSLQPLVFAKMKKLDVYVNSWKSVDPSIFRQMPYLEDISWHVPLDAVLLIAMLEMCPLLNKLELTMELSDSNLSILQYLLKLNQLRSLAVNVINEDRDLFLDFSKLIHLEELHLRSFKIIPISLMSLAKSLTSLWLCVIPKNEKHVMSIISSSLTQLKKLHLAYKDILVSKDVLKVLTQLKKLEELQFFHCLFNQSFFVGVDAPLSNLHTLRFLRCKLETKHFLGLQEAFPNMKKLDFVECCNDAESDFYQAFHQAINSLRLS